MKKNALVLSLIFLGIVGILFFYQRPESEDIFTLKKRIDNIEDSLQGTRICVDFNGEVYRYRGFPFAGTCISISDVVIALLKSDNKSVKIDFGKTTQTKVVVKKRHRK